MSRSPAEKKFLDRWNSWFPHLPLEREVKCIDKRKYSFDFAHRDSKVAIEIQGGIWLRQGGHNTGKGLNRDYEKLNLAQVEGWVVFQLSGDMLRFAWLDLIQKTIIKRLAND